MLEVSVSHPFEERVWKFAAERLVEPLFPKPAKQSVEW